MNASVRRAIFIYLFIYFFMVGYNRKKLSKCILTAGCRATTAKTNTKIRVITIKKVLSPQSCPDGVNQWKRNPEKTNVAR